MRHLISGLCVALVGCANPSAEEDPVTIDQDVAATFGGLDEADEEPAFGDELIAVELSEEDPAVADPLPPDDVVGARHIRVAIGWGYLRPHRDATEELDWSGTISVENAGLRVLRTIRFEERDSVTPPTERTEVAFVSHTKPHFDGLLLDVVVPPETEETRGPVTLTFTSAPFTGSLTLEPGMRLTRVVPIDNAGHVIAYHIVRPDPVGDGCIEGFVGGVWDTKGEVAGHEVGVLKGRLTAADGTIHAHLRGVFGERRNGRHVWFAKVVGPEGRFRGVMAGRYADGKLAGLFLGRGRLIHGVVKGVYRDGDGDGDGAFQGRFSERCREDAREGQPAESDEPEVELEDRE